MDRRQIELQIRIIRVTFRAESLGEKSHAMQQFRVRAAAILAEVERWIGEFPDLEVELADLRREIGLAD